MVRQLLFFIAIGACSTYGFEGAAQDLVGDEGGGTSIDVVERIPATVIEDGGRGPRRVFSVKFLCGRVDPLESLLGVDEGIVGDDLAPGTGIGGIDDDLGDIGFGDDIGGIGIGDRIGDVGGIGVGDRGIGIRDRGIGVIERRLGPLDGFDFGRMVAPGVYRTVITVFNPGLGEVDSPLRLVPTLPFGLGEFGRPTPFVDEALPARRGFEVDCLDILDRFGGFFGVGGLGGFGEFRLLELLDTVFISGLFLIETDDRPLDVSAVYTVTTAD